MARARTTVTKFKIDKGVPMPGQAEPGRWKDLILAMEISKYTTF